MITIAVDLNDVLRKYTDRVLDYFEKEYNRSVMAEDIDYSTNNPADMLPFPSEGACERFLYEDYPYEIYGSCPGMESGLGGKFNYWLKEIVGELDSDEKVNILLVSGREYELTIQATYFFLSKIGSRAREVYFPTDRTLIWDRCDIFITADPMMLKNKPEDKVTVKIDADYNNDCEADFRYSSFSRLIDGGENELKKILEQVKDKKE